jgi:hypothetical protein
MQKEQASKRPVTIAIQILFGANMTGRMPRVVIDTILIALTQVKVMKLITLLYAASVATSAKIDYFLMPNGGG